MQAERCSPPTAAPGSRAISGLGMTEVKPRIVTLRVSFAEGLRRAQGDFAARLDPAGTTDLVVDTEQTTPERLAAELADSLLDRHGPDG